MIDMSPGYAPMKLYRAVYRESNQKTYNLDLLAHNKTRATLSAAELIPTDAVLLQVFHNPEW
jgi:hypothetical protein